MINVTTKKLVDFPKHLTSVKDLSADNIRTLFERANWMSIRPRSKLQKLGKGLILGNIFFQSSTRTRLGFETAMLRLGGSVTGFADVGTTRAGDFFQESLEDTVRVLSQYADCLVIRHPADYSAEIASKASIVPVINAGDGKNEHPTQALLDAWILTKLLGDLTNKTIGLVGDPQFRVLRSMIIVLKKLNVGRLIFMPPSGVSLSDQEKTELTKSNIYWQVEDNIQALLDQTDAICMISLVMPNCNEGKAKPLETTENLLDPKYVLTPEKIMQKGNKCPYILHAGPRGPELPGEIHGFPTMQYYLQSRYGVYLRAALINLLT